MMTEDSAFVAQGSISSVLAIYLQQAVLRMVPYAVPALIIIILDLVYGVRAARHRKEKVRFSTALRRTITKSFTYVCWLILASTLAIAFAHVWVEWVLLGMVYLNELSSVIGNYLETKGLELNWKTIWGAVVKIGGQKAGVDTDGIDPTEFVQHKKEGDE